MHELTFRYCFLSFQVSLQGVTLKMPKQEHKKKKKKKKRVVNIFVGTCLALQTARSGRKPQFLPQSKSSEDLAKCRQLGESVVYLTHRKME